MLKIVGKKEILGNEVLVVEGGFGEGKKILFDVQIAEIHQVKTIHIREAINKMINRGRMNEGIDFIDLKQRIDMVDTFDLTELYAKQSITQAKNIYILSERGYTKLIKLLNDDKSWDIMEQIVDEYFTMRSIINSLDNEKNKLLLDLFSNDPMIVASAHKQLVALETAPLQQEIVELKPLAERYNIFLDIDGLTDIDSFSKQLAISGLGRNAMYSYMRDQKFLQSGAKQNVPYAQYVNGKTQLFKVKNTGFRIDRSGNRIPTTKTYLTAKGVDYFLKRFTNEGLIN